MLHEPAVEDGEVADRGQAEVQEVAARVHQYQQTHQLPRDVILAPRDRKHVRRQHVPVGGVQNEVHCDVRRQLLANHLHVRIWKEK